MSDRFNTARNGSDPRAHALVGAYMRAGYARIDPPLLQPAEPFLDLSGEDIRRRMFLTTDPQGREMCLRPLVRSVLRRAQAVTHYAVVHIHNQPSGMSSAPTSSRGPAPAAGESAFRPLLPPEF